jgi:tRNA-splicing ligase RtcB
MHARPVSTHGDGLVGIVLKRRYDELWRRYDELRILKRVGKYDHGRVWLQMGTLAGGNHFIELCLDEEGRVWVMLHSGSRNVGKTIGETAISMAREVALKLDRQLPDRDLAWLDEGTVAFDGRPLVHRSWKGQCGFLLLLLPRGRASDVARGCQADVLA